MVDVMEELAKFTPPARDCAGHLADRRGERHENAEALSGRVSLRSL